MDSLPTIAELPGLYRAILDAVGELERRGERSRAGRIRAEASAAYSTWDEPNRRRLAQLHTRADRFVADLEPEARSRADHRPPTGLP